MTSYELLAHVINMKYHHAMPPYRLETYFKILGATLSRQTLSNWVIGVADTIAPIYDTMFNLCEKIYSIKKQAKEQCGNDANFYEKRYEIKLENTAPIFVEYVKFKDELLEITPCSAVLPEEVKISNFKNQ